MSEHELKVLPPYFDAIADGSKTFEVRVNDRAYQRGDVLRLREWHAERTSSARECPVAGCKHKDWHSTPGHWGADIVIVKRVTFAYSGDPRFGGLEPGYVVLGLGDLS